MALVKNLPANAEDIEIHGFNPWIRKSSWRRERQPSPVFLPGKSHAQRSLWATVHEITESDTSKVTYNAHRHGVVREN